MCISIGVFSFILNNEVFTHEYLLLLYGKLPLIKIVKGEDIMTKNDKPKPDDRSDNVEKLQHMVQNTLENIEEAEESMEFASEDQKHKIKDKNKRRKEAIEGMRDEIKDEARHDKIH